MFSGFKIKLNVKKEQGDGAPSGQPGPSANPSQPSANNGAPQHAASLHQAPPKADGASKPMIGAKSTAPGGPLKTFKLKMPSGPMTNMTGPVTSMGPPRPKSASNKPKLKRPAGSMQPNAGFSGAPGGHLRTFSPQSKKFKLATASSGPIKLKTTGTFNFAAPPTHAPPPPQHNQQPLGTAHLPPRVPVFHQPKKRGRKPKTDPDSLFQRQARMVDEVTYKISSPPPPRAHSLRQSASQLTFGEDGVRNGFPGGPPFGSDMGMPFPGGEGMAMGGGIATEDGGPAAAAAIREPYVPQPYPTPNFPATPPTKEELSRLLSKIKEKDTIHIFHEPVTDTEAPGYMDVIQTPMDLSTMRKKVEDGAYPEWLEFWEDLDLMFMNALTYNQPPDTIHNYALRLRKTVATMVSKVRANAKAAAGVTKRAAAQKKLAAVKAERDAAARLARQEAKAAQEAKVLRRAGVGDDGVGEDLEARATYKPHSTNPMAGIWGGLYGGCSIEGASFGRERLLLKANNPIPSSEGYAASMLRFASGLVGRAKDLVMAKVAAARETRENVVPPTNPPAMAASTTAAQQGKGGKKAKQQQQQQQQPAAAVLAPPPVSLFHSQQQPPPALGSLPPVTALTGVNTLPGAKPMTMIQPTPAMAAAASAHLLAAQAQAHIGSAHVSGAPGHMQYPPQMHYVYQMPTQQQPPQATQGTVQQGTMMPGMVMSQQPGQQYYQPGTGAPLPSLQQQQQSHQTMPPMTMGMAGLPMPMQGQQVMYQVPPPQQQNQFPPS